MRHAALGLRGPRSRLRACGGERAAGGDGRGADARADARALPYRDRPQRAAGLQQGHRAGRRRRLRRLDRAVQSRRGAERYQRLLALGRRERALQMADPLADDRRRRLRGDLLLKEGSGRGRAAYELQALRRRRRGLLLFPAGRIALGTVLRELRGRLLDLLRGRGAALHALPHAGLSQHAGGL